MTRQRSTGLTSLAALTVGLFLLGAGTAAAGVPWRTTSSGTGAAKAAALSSPAVGTPSGVASSTATIGWTAPGTWQNAATYTATATAATHPTKSCSAPASAGSCTLTGLDATTTYSVAVGAMLHLWSSGTSTTSFTTTASPTITVDKPTANQVIANNGDINNKCPNNTTGICGTATAGSGTLGTGAATLTVRRTVGTTVTFWNGTSWVASSTTLTATGTTAWLYSITYSQLRAGSITGTATYLVSATVTDSLGGTATTTRSFSTT